MHRPSGLSLGSLRSRETMHRSTGIDMAADCIRGNSLDSHSTVLTRSQQPRREEVPDDDLQNHSPARRCRAPLRLRALHGLRTASTRVAELVPVIRARPHALDFPTTSIITIQGESHVVNPPLRRPATDPRSPRASAPDQPGYAPAPRGQTSPATSTHSDVNSKRKVGARPFTVTNYGGWA